KDVFSTKKHVSCLHKHNKTDGTNAWVNILLSPMFDKNGEVVQVIEACRNVDEIMRAQDEINKLSTAVEQSPASIIVTDIEGKIEYVNPMFSSLSGYILEEVKGERTFIINSGIIPESEQQLLYSDILNGNSRKMIYHNLSKQGKNYWVSSLISPLRNVKGEVTGIIEVQEDITQRLKDQKQIESDLKEKDLLLQEIYHRVNNNMQIMISLFDLQIEHTDIQFEKDVLVIAQSRVSAMSAIHNDIYQSMSFTAINFNNVISSIFSTLCDSLMVFYGNIELHVEADVPDFGLDLAQPSALIVSELLSNSMRHAYPDGKGPIYVSLSENESDEITLLVKDNGVGIPESIVPENSDTTGFSLVYMLATGQLDGAMEINRDNGTSVKIKFKRIDDKMRF
ncbi:MAG: PAS domain S-box protein, partial [Spirochaetales bacterium]|nr:PAS domain S-box protein [Spirochaetales bacterium]